MALGTWKIWNDYEQTGAWETLDYTNLTHSALLTSRAEFHIQDDGLAGSSDQVTDVLPRMPNYDLYIFPVEITIYSAGTASFAVCNPADIVNDYVPMDGGGSFHRPAVISTTAPSAGLAKGPLPPNTRIVVRGLTGEGAAKINVTGKKIK